MSGSQASSQLQLPVLDISQPLDASSLSSLREACGEWGFFYIANHGLSDDLYRKIHSLSNPIFDLPEDAKQKLRQSLSHEAYIPRAVCSPFFECMRVQGPDFVASASSFTDILFDSPKPEFSEILQEYGNKMMEISRKVTEILLACLGDNFCQYFGSEFSNCNGYFRIINYSPPDTFGDEDVEGVGTHTDFSCITIVRQDDIGGLQVRSKKGEWMDIHPYEGNLVVNIGDMLQAWSNGRLRSSEHRVVLKQPVNRFSTSFFWCFEDDKTIFAPNEVVGDGNSRNYKPFSWSDYLRFRESSGFGHSKLVKMTVKDFAMHEAPISSPA